MIISQKAFDLIVEEETGGKAYYQAKEIHTDWPGGRSGVTVGCGYDCGYETKGQIAADWGDKLRADMVVHLQDCAGVHGSPARALAHEIRDQITVPWDVALDVFRNRDVPRWEAIVKAHLPNTDKLSPDSFGALVSLAFNRGASFDLDGDRYEEMRCIKEFMEDETFENIPHAIRSMTRLWPVGSDLWKRRKHEAELFESGLMPHSGVAV